MMYERRARFNGMIQDELDKAEAKHPKFSDFMTGRSYKAIKDALLFWRRHNEKAPYHADSILFEEIYEAVEAYKKDEKVHCIQELAQCAAVILRMMGFVEDEIKVQAKTPIVVNVDAGKLNEYEELFSKISSIDSIMPFRDKAKELANDIERGMFEVMAKNKVAEVYVVDGCINYDGEIARYDSVIVFNEDAAKDLAQHHNTVYTHYNFTAAAKMPDDEFERIIEKAQSSGNKNADVVREWRKAVREE